MSKSVIIIGAGMAGLSAGCYGQMNGYETHVFEMHNKPGGLCTAWEKNGYTVDGCLHWLTGSAPGAGMYKLWQELGMIQGQRIYDPETFYRYESADGHVFDFYTDLSRLQKHMLEIAPEDKAVIKRTIRAIRSFSRMNMPVDKAPELYSVFDMLRMAITVLLKMGVFSKYSTLTVKELAESFNNPLLRAAWQNAWPPEFASMFVLMTMASMHKKQAGYVIGGSMNLSRAIEKRYIDLGGQINYRSRVTKILVEDDCAVGVILEDGSEHRAEYIISAADGHTTIFDMLEGNYIDEKIQIDYEQMPIFQPLIYIGIGVNRKFDDIPPAISGICLELKDPVIIAGAEQKWLNVRIHNFDQSLAPDGKTLVTVTIESPFDYWSNLHNDTDSYRAEKELVADIVIEQLEERFPGFKSQVEMVDVATPVTFHRYTGNWQGSYEGWLMTPDAVTLKMSKTLPGLHNFYMAGQWVMAGGGIPSGAMTGRFVIQMMCRSDKQQFVAFKP
ncbi:MAG: NAD(P)/FAD-dependent oxidoreductase [Dehalococcoidia bacterium]|nr:NAD(P)/FAD-dependent oxidoreductase [Dehalococcoidia bacterium]